MRDDGFEHVDRGIGAFRCKAAPLPRAGIDGVGGAFRHCKWRQPHECGLIETLGPLVFRQVKPVRRQGLVDRAATGMLQRLAPRLVIIDDLAKTLARGVLALRLDRKRRVAAIIEQPVHPLPQYRPPIPPSPFAPALPPAPSPYN